MSEYLILLIELHNTFSLFLNARKQQKDENTPELKEWANEIYKEMKRINDKLMDGYTDQFLELQDAIEQAANSPQYIKIDRFLSTGYFSQIYHRLRLLKQMKSKFLKDFEPTTPELKERI